MRFLTGLCLCLVFSAPARAASAAAPPVHPGVLEIALDPAVGLTLPLDAPSLAYHLCNDFLVDGLGGISARGECELSVGPPTLGMELEWIEGQEPSLAAWVRPASSEPWRSKAPLSTSCGLWDFWMELDPLQPQGASRLALESSPVAGPVQGVFSGVLQLGVRFHFVLRDKGKAYELPARLPLELQGHWAAMPADGPIPKAGASNLVLYAVVVDGQWASFPTCGLWGGTFCRVCLGANPDVVGSFSGQ